VQPMFVEALVSDQLCAMDSATDPELCHTAARCITPATDPELCHSTSQAEGLTPGAKVFLQSDVHEVAVDMCSAPLSLSATPP
jgi:hypothetical protein